MARGLRKRTRLILQRALGEIQLFGIIPRIEAGGLGFFGGFRDLLQGEIGADAFSDRDQLIGWMGRMYTDGEVLDALHHRLGNARESETLAFVQTEIAVGTNHTSSRQSRARGQRHQNAEQFHGFVMLHNFSKKGNPGYFLRLSRIDSFTRNRFIWWA